MYGADAGKTVAEIWRKTGEMLRRFQENMDTALERNAEKAAEIMI
jgi:hypothetical protein